MYPGGAKFVACGHYYNNVVTSKGKILSYQLFLPAIEIFCCGFSYGRVIRVSTSILIQKIYFEYNIPLKIIGKGCHLMPRSTFLDIALNL